MRIHRVILLTGLLAFTAVSAFAAPIYTRIANEAQVLAVTSKADYDPGPLAVNPATGVIYTVDFEGTGTDTYLRVVPGATPTIAVLTTEALIVAALEAVNGTTTATNFTCAAIDVAADGDIIIAGFSPSVANGDSLISVTDAGVITVVYTSVNGANSAIDGVTSMTVMGNTAYVGTDDSQSWASTDEIVTIDTNAPGPAATPTVLVAMATLQAALPGYPATEVALNALSNDGTHVYGVASESATALDDVVRITAGGAVSVYLSDADMTADLNAVNTTTDLGFGCLTVDAQGDIWLGNAFGVATEAYDDSILQVTGIAPPNGNTAGYPKANLWADLGLSATIVNNDSLDFDALNNRVLFTEGSSGAGTNESIIAGPNSSGTVPAEISVFSAN